jgi:hypothetical protein
MTSVNIVSTAFRYDSEWERSREALRVRMFSPEEARHRNRELRNAFLLNIVKWKLLTIAYSMSAVDSGREH